MNTNYMYRGRVIPELMNRGGELTCDNSYCACISCFDCINYPTGVVDEIKQDYLRGIEYDEQLSESIERVSECGYYGEGKEMD